MAERKVRLTYESIPIDSRRRVDVNGESTVLLYDSANACYYQTTVHNIIAGVERKANERIEAIEREFAEYKDSVEARMAAFKEALTLDMAKYKSDMSKTMATLIEMVEASSAGE